MKRLLIFDAMGVIFKVSDDVKYLLYPFLKSKSPVLSYDKLREGYLKLSLGKITSHEFFAELGFKGSYSQLEKEYLDTRIELDEGFLPFVRSLGEEYDFAMLSNDASSWSKYLRQKHSIDSLFADTTISADVGARKPQKEIYEVMLIKSGRKAEDCVFIDDRMINLDTAKKLGMKTIWFNRNGLHSSYCGPIVKNFSEIPGFLPTIFD